MKPNPNETLRIPLVNFLKLNGYGLLESSNELPDWYLFLNYIAYFLETDFFNIRGSAIAQAIIKICAESKHKLLDSEKNTDDFDIKMVLVPYTTTNLYLRSNPRLKVELRDDDPNFKEKSKQKKYSTEGTLTEEEFDFFEMMICGVSKKNIDLYLNLDARIDINFYAPRFAKSFNDRDKAKIVDVNIFPNGVAALEIEIKGGYVDHSLNLVLKPPLQQDLRKNLSDRQLASKGKLVRDGDSWFMLVNQKDAQRILEQEKLSFLEKYLDLPELILQVARSFRFNAIYKVEGGSEIRRSDLELAVEKLTLALNKESSLDRNSKHILANSMNEFMLSFLYDPELFIDFVLRLPSEFFPYINREALEQNKDQIIEILSRKIGDYSTTDQEKNTDLTVVAALLVGNNPNGLFESKVGKKYKPIIDSVDRKLGNKYSLEDEDKLGLTRMIDSEFTHTSWNFNQLTTYYLFVFLFHPLAQ